MFYWQNEGIVGWKTKKLTYDEQEKKCLEESSNKVGHMTMKKTKVLHVYLTKSLLILTTQKNTYIPGKRGYIEFC